MKTLLHSTPSGENLHRVPLSLRHYLTYLSADEAFITESEQFSLCIYYSQSTFMYIGKRLNFTFTNLKEPSHVQTSTAQ